jgi:hypothetical protein
MTRQVLTGCLSICCLSRRMRRSFPIEQVRAIDGQQSTTKMNQVQIRSVGSIRISNQTSVGEATNVSNHMNNKSTNETTYVARKMSISYHSHVMVEKSSRKCQSVLSENIDGSRPVINRTVTKSHKTNGNESSRRVLVETLFHRTETLSTVPIVDTAMSKQTENNIDHSLSSEWSTTTTTTMNQAIEEKNLSNEFTRMVNIYLNGANSATKQRTSSHNDLVHHSKSSGKSRLVLQHVRKMIDDQSIDEQCSYH